MQQVYAEAVDAIFSQKVKAHHHTQAYVSRKTGKTKWGELEMWPVHVSFSLCLSDCPCALQLVPVHVSLSCACELVHVLVSLSLCLSACLCWSAYPCACQLVPVLVSLSLTCAKHNYH